MTDNIIRRFKDRNTIKIKYSPVVTCPVYCGYRQHDKKIREVFSKKQIDLNNYERGHMIIVGMVKKNIDYTRLKDVTITSSSNCLSGKFDMQPSIGCI